MKMKVLFIIILFIQSCSISINTPDIDYSKLRNALDDNILISDALNKDSLFFKKGIITLQGEIGSAYMRFVSEQILLLDSMENISKITIILNSTGGDYSAAIFLVNTIQSINKKVDIICNGYCFSAAAGILQSATGKRLTLPKTLFMVHAPQPTNKNVKIPERALIISNNYYTELISKKSKLPNDWFPLSKKMHYFSVDEAKKYMFVDEVLDKLKL